MSSLVHDILISARGRWDVIIQDITGYDGKPSHCPRHGGKTGRAFSGKKKAYKETGKSFCNTCGCNHNGIQTISFLMGWSNRDTTLYLKDYLKGKGDLKPVSGIQLAKMQAEQKKKDEEEARVLRAIMKREWAKTIPLSSPEAAIGVKYLNSRKAITKRVISDDLHIRFHPKAQCFVNGEKSYLPALFFALRNAKGKIRNIQRYFLNSEGKLAKDIISKPKLFFKSPNFDGYLDSCSIQIGRETGRTGVINVCEGVDTGGTINRFSGFDAQVHACTGKNLLERWEVPEALRNKVQTVNVWADNDESGAGVESAMALYEKLTEQGYNVYVYTPKAFGDWNDYPEECYNTWLGIYQSLKAA